MESECDELVQGQSAMNQLMNEFCESVAASEEAASMLSTTDALSSSIERSVASLVTGISATLTQADSARTGKVGLGTELRNEQIRAVELELELEERTKALEEAMRQSAALSERLKQSSKDNSELTRQVT